MELNPALNVRNKTAELAVDLIESLFGKRTLSAHGPDSDLNSHGLPSGP